MAEETNFNRIKNIDRRLIKRGRAEKFDKVLLRFDGKDIELPRRLARSRIARVFANRDGKLDSKAIDEMFNGNEDSEKLAVAIIKSLDSDVARKLNKTLNNADIVTKIDERTEANDALSQVERDRRIEERREKKERRRRQRQESQPDVDRIYNAEFDDVEEV